jgi:hypothetical protein
MEVFKSSQKEINFYTVKISLLLCYVTIQSPSSTIRPYNILHFLTTSLHYARPMPGSWAGYLCCITCSHNALFIHRPLFAENWTSSSLLPLHTSALYLYLLSRVTSYHNSLFAYAFSCSTFHRTWSS